MLLTIEIYVNHSQEIAVHFQGEFCGTISRNAKLRVQLHVIGHYGFVI